MLTILLCGASDTQAVSQDFADEVRGFGGEPWFYQSGDILYANTAHADWRENSTLSVQQADMCVFVLMHDIGRITWDVELNTALRHGKPFLLLCLEETYHRYLDLSRARPGPDALAPGDRDLVELLHRLDATLNLTSVPFARPFFRDVLRTQLSGLFADGLRQMQQRNQRDNVLAGLRPGRALSDYEQHVLTTIALDETEFVRTRKQALTALFGTPLAADDLRDLVASPSQGIARLTIDHLPDLVPAGAVDPDLLDFCVKAVNDSDDIGLAHRLINRILDLSLPDALRTLARMDLDEPGGRRRLAGALEAHEDAIVAAGLQAEASALLARCLVKSDEKGWMARGRAFLERLSARDATTATGPA